MVRSAVLMLAAVMVAGCSTVPGGGFPSPPRYEPVGQTVLVSADSRLITAIGPVACGHAPRLVARAYPDKVSLIFENPDTNCNAEVIGSALASTELPMPLGNRALVHVGSTRGTIPYFSERDLASIGRLPFGLRLSSDAPADVTGPQGQPEIGDTRTYVSPDAAMEITQIVPSPPLQARRYWFSTSCPIVAGWYARHGFPACRTVTWVTHGYHFLVSMAVEHGMTLSVREFRTTAQAVLLSPGQYRLRQRRAVQQQQWLTEKLQLQWGSGRTSCIDLE